MFGAIVNVFVCFYCFCFMVTFFFRFENFFFLQVLVDGVKICNDLLLVVLF